MTSEAFEKAYAELNSAQRTAVDWIDGPVMVVAGPGTGKTQVLALRIANILEKTDLPASGILCLTFTRSGVTAMRSRLEGYIGARAREVKITTFHSFGIELIEKYYHLLDFHRPPELVDDSQAVSLIDDLLQNHEWEYLRPRTNPTIYFNDLKQLISILKRERLSPSDFLTFVDADIKQIQNDPDSISSRGESKGKLKRDVEKKIEALSRTREVVQFYELYEELKKKQGLMDYDDVLEYAVQLAEISDEVRAYLQVEYQYILIDEHQDSSGVQNSFLQAVWKDSPITPNIFVVGDDRQLIYGFSGAHLDYFKEFSHIFGKAKLITLTENYRSTSPILSLADELLQSSVTQEKLNSNTMGDHKIALSEYVYSRDEIIGAGMYFKKVIDEGISPGHCAILVPKNHQVRTAVSTLRGLGLPVVSEGSPSLFSVPETQSLRRVLNIIKNPFDSVAISESLLDATSGIAPLHAHAFIRSIKKPDQMKIEDLVASSQDAGMFAGQGTIAVWGNKLSKWISELSHEPVSVIVSIIGNELLIDRADGHEELIKNVEVVRSFIHLATMWEEKNPKGNLAEFLEYFGRLETYGTHVGLAQFGMGNGIHVMTLHKSKGLEYDHVWIAHMNEEVFMSEKRTNFTLPEKVKEKMAARDEQTARRELYVAITRAKRFCTISYAQKNYNGADMELARIVQDLSVDHFTKKSAHDTETEIINQDPKLYIAKPDIAKNHNTAVELQTFVRVNYPETKVSVTLLNNFFECPWKWYFRNFLRLPEVKGVSLALGSAVHSTIEYILKSAKLPNQQEIDEKIHDELIHEGVRDDQEIKRLAKSAKVAVVNWVDGFYQHLAKDYSSERSLSFRDPQFPNLTMYGKIDLTERFPDSTITVTDFKTGSSKTTGMIEKVSDDGRLSDYMRQLAMYSYLMRGGEKGTVVTASRLLFLEADQSDKNALYSTHVRDEQIDLLIRDISDYQNLLESGEWMKQECHAKLYGSESECEYCKRAERIFGK